MIIKFSKNSKKFIFALFVLLFIVSPLSALDFWPEGGFAGIGLEVNGHSREDYSYGGGIILGIDLNKHFSAGLKTTFFDNFVSLSALETLLFFRYNLPWPHIPRNIDGPFAQIETGSMLYIERGYHDNLEVFPAFSGGLAIGWRFNIGEHWYVEPAGRYGYPHTWGAGVTAGIRFKEKQPPVVVEQKNEIKEGDVIGDMKIISDDEGNFRLQVFSIMFRNNQADFTGLSEETVKSNYDTLKSVAEFLNKYTDYKIVIEGHANPTTPEGRAREQEKNTVHRLSEQRAHKVMEILKEYGVSSHRMKVEGAGFSKMLAPYNDTVNNWKNRRVEIILIKE